MGANRQNDFDSPRLSVVAIGAGYWGQNMIRVMQSCPAVELVAVCDANPDAAQSAAQRHGCDAVTSLDEALQDYQFDAIYLATPPQSHAQLTEMALNEGKHVLVEKPLTTDSSQANALVQLAQDRGLTLMAGHTFLFSPPVNKIKDLISSGTLGQIFYIDSHRVNLGKYQDSGVVWDLAPHDLSIAMYWLDERPSAVSAHGRAFRSTGAADVAFVTVEFPSGATVQLHMSWLAPVKLRRTTISGSNQMVVYDDTAGPEAVKIFDYGIDPKNPESHGTFGEFQLTYRQGDIVIPRLEATEPLRSELEHFVDAIRTNTPVRSGARFGAEVVKVVEAAQLSMTSGQKIVIDWPTPASHRPRFGAIAPDIAISKAGK